MGAKMSTKDGKGREEKGREGKGREREGNWKRKWMNRDFGPGPGEGG